MTSNVLINNKQELLNANKQFFQPPVCNKMMHQKGQMKSFFVGGPNIRKDYHIEEGEEMFYMEKGDMCLKIVEHGKHRDIPIKEGEVNMASHHALHSPQRQKNTIGLVLERERPEDELDGLRYYVEGTTDSLYEKWFHCTDLGTQLVPVINAFFESEQYKTGKPIPEELPDKPPVELDSDVSVEMPFSLRGWIEKNKEEIQSKGYKKIFADHYQHSITVWGSGEEKGGSDVAEIWMWQLEGKSELVVGDEKTKYEVNKDDIVLVPQGWKYTANRGDGSLCLVCFQDPTKKKPWKKE
ncbi:3-hydroxyanthranilate 3,4-dioxygenase-like [Saccoglossus kowalevskii]|uniref:3-hydroxyanthranilate 3,4-dioxygenase n=1 Tax=Saccoglossus kowalevskii TaxID=10224 RepID=A0ABM0M4U4_SACKO|nr:PREDICTED: 3-hydroxyanthranilate 3,4-dioxygenase-like [Saccoglossus kowalevskii]